MIPRYTRDISPKMLATIPIGFGSSIQWAAMHYLHHKHSDTDLDPLYRTVRYNVNAYRLRVPNGPYRVTLRTFSTISCS